jgi:CRP/FNR family transcriptional regulator, cyclic AMP receptor protein
MPSEFSCIFQKLRPNDVTLLSAARGRTIFMQDQDASFVYHLHEGLVAGIRITREGNEITDLIVPNQFIGLMGFLNMYENRGRLHLAEARAITPITYCKVRREAVWEMMDDRGARSKIVHMICGSIIYRGTLAASSIKLDVSNRVLHVMQMLARSIGKRFPDNTALIENVSHNDIAMVANTTRPTVTRTLDKLEKIGLIKVNLRHIVVQDYRRLLDMTSFTTVEDLLEQTRG